MLSATTWMLMVAAALGSPQEAAAAPPATAGPATNTAVIEHCQVFLLKDVHISANESGAIVSLQVQEGNHVQAGAILGKIDDRQAQYDKLAAELKRNAALAKSQDDIEVRFSEAAFGVADAELTQSLEINRRSSRTVSEAEIRRLKLTRQKAQLAIERSQFELRIAGVTADIETTAVAAAEAGIERRQIVAPFSGMVLEVLRDTSEWVNAGDPVLRLIQLDRLRVEGFLDAGQFNPEDVDGCPVTVAIRRARGQVVQLPGRVVFVSPLVQAGNKYRVRAEVENRLSDQHWVLGPGMTATMAIHVEQR